ncbi:MAG TPA: M50 family metallopeptidase [Opitutaceae bacterium]|nr:M50 family metallopeptidase [Opitutaceae bacterium]
MISTQSGSLRLFRFAGIQVYLHWSWFVVALIELSSRAKQYGSPFWNVAEYLALFAIVLLHEFGHALACRSVGGKAEQIVLWPLGGIAFVSPPMRPGAVLWSIAAGPLVNVVLAPILFGLVWLGSHLGWTETMPDLTSFVFAVAITNAVLLVFNLMPVYPLDGGQIVQSLLWFWLGRARSLFVSAILGLVGVSALGVYALWRQSLWYGFMALFLGQRCLAGLRYARGLSALAKVPRHPGFACPSCHEPPPGGPMWLCGSCGQRFNPFSTAAVCPHCSTRQPATMCAFCGVENPIEAWSASSPAAGVPPVIDV